MPKEAIIIALITSLTTGHILFLALYLWARTGKHLPNRILSVLLFCYALRIIKSVLLLAFPEIPFANVLIALGVIGMSAIGPLLWLYVQSITGENFRITYKSLLHFLPAAFLLPTAFFLDDKAMFQVYQFSVYQIILYILFSMFYFRNRKKLDATVSNHKWVSELFAAAGFLSIIFLIQLYTGNRTLYMAVSILAAAIFYIISLRAAFGKDPFYPQLKRKPNSGKSNLLPSIDAKLRAEKLFLDPQLTVSKLALSLKIPAYTLSAAINEESGMGFNEFLNSYRVKEAAARLTSAAFEHLSIEGIAYDCGFNSLSAFYNAFKKVYHVTPAKYRQQSFPDSLNQEDLIRKVEKL